MTARLGSRERGSTWHEVYEIVRVIPPGKVMTYGQIAGLLDCPLSPRAVGWALHDCPDNVPWHRVVNARGGCSTDALPTGETGRQRRLLEAEEVRFRPSGTLDLGCYRWDPGDA